MDTDCDEEAVRSPKMPITIHLNMNDLLPPSKHDFKFHITGTVLLTPRQPLLGSSRRYYSSPNPSHPASDDEVEIGIMVLPRFRVLHSDREYVSCTVRNDAQDATLDVYNSAGDIRDAQTRKTVLQRGGHIKCGTDGARISLRPVKRSPSPSRRSRENGLHASKGPSRSRPRTPSGTSHRDISPSLLRQSLFTSMLRTPVRRDGPLMIPYVNATITPLLIAGSTSSPKYAVRINLPAPSDDDLEWLEFGLALPRMDGDPPVTEQPKVEVASASIEGVPVRVTTRAVTKPEVNGSTVPFGDASAKEWITWVRVHVGEAGGGKMDILYLVTESGRSAPEKEKPVSATPTPIILSALLPSFSLPVGELEVQIPVQTGWWYIYCFALTLLIDRVPGFDIIPYETNLAHEQISAQGRKLTHYSMEEYFYPRLFLVIRASTPTQAPIPQGRFRSWSRSHILTALLAIICVVLCISLRQTQVQLSAALRSANAIETDVAFQSVLVHTITITTTTTATETIETLAVSSTHSYVPSAQQQTTNAHAPSSPPPPPADVAFSSSSPSTARSIPTITPIPVAAPDAGDALATLHSFSTLWSFRLELPPLPDIKLPPAANATLQTVLDSLDTVYQLFRKVLHYPLDPP